MAQSLRALRYDPDSNPPTWEFQLIEDGVPGAIYRTIRPGEENNPTRITIADPETPSVMHDLVVLR